MTFIYSQTSKQFLGVKQFSSDDKLKAAVNDYFEDVKELDFLNWVKGWSITGLRVLNYMETMFKSKNDSRKKR